MCRMVVACGALSKPSTWPCWAVSCLYLVGWLAPTIIIITDIVFARKLMTQINTNSIQWVWVVYLSNAVLHFLPTAQRTWGPQKTVWRATCDPRAIGLHIPALEAVRISLYKDHILYTENTNKIYCHPAWMIVYFITYKDVHRTWISFVLSSWIINEFLKYLYKHSACLNLLQL